ncbi:phage terminase large subunit (GpA) [Oxobacter pfennigii]|uniref:Phage terminase large subunit (GpA) n=2 Tax=Oxobacter pfennigii TaxID=36849 RepID=A0A0P8W192_9CLOT|nr:phage terminase large subunit (GpA) [Oxobacter pfennigii]
MDSFNDPEIEESVICKSTQIGGTEGANNMVGYIIEQDPSPTMIVYPTIDLAEWTSKNRLKPMVDLCPKLKERYHEGESKLLELQFDGMFIALSGANSPSSLASKPVRFVIMDELDKFPLSSGKEADPRKLAIERTRTYPTSKKIIKISTPTRKANPIWQEWESADDQRRYYVPCPHCGHHQTFKFKQIKWPKESTAEEAQATAYYECEECKGMIMDSHKQTMIISGKWISERKTGTRKTAFHINAIYSPWLKFGDIAYEFLKSKDFPELLMNFVNSWLAEPWEQTDVKLNSDLVLERQSEYDEGVVPDGTQLITAGVDVQRGYFYYTIRAWGTSMTSWNIAHGQAETWDQIESIMNYPFEDRYGNQYQVNLCAVDSGDRTDEVYEFCVINQEWAVPVKGSSRPLQSRYSMSTIEKVDSKAYGMRLYMVDGGQYKDMIAGRLNRPNGTGSWMVYKGCDRDYAEQICAEEKVIEKKGGIEVEVWRPKSSHAANHYLDSEVYAALAADLLHVRYLQFNNKEQQEQRPKPQPQSNFIKQESSWIQQRGRWLR